MSVKELKELIELYEAVRDTGISIQEVIHMISRLEEK